MNSAFHAPRSALSLTLAAGLFFAAGGAAAEEGPLLDARAWSPEVYRLPPVTPDVVLVAYKVDGGPGELWSAAPFNLVAGSLRDPSSRSRSDRATIKLLPREPDPPVLVRLPLVEPREERILEPPTTLSGVLTEQWNSILADHAEFYSPESLLWLAGGFGAGAVVANTNFDERVIRDEYAENVIFARSDELYEALHEPKFLGNGWYTVPVFAAAALAEPWIEDLPLGSATAEWGQRSFRAALVGGPPLLLAQVATGGSRPGEAPWGSRWRPFHDNNGVSGHSFMGAVPFISAAKMSDNPWLKAGFYAASVFPGLSRINDDRHYFSQVCLGWWIAYLSASAVDRAQNRDARRRFFLFSQDGGLSLGFRYQH